MPDPIPGDRNYDPSVQGVPVNIVDGAGGVGASLDALKTSVDALTVAINALIAAMEPS